MKKYTFTLTIEEVTTNNVVNSIIEKVAEEQRVKKLIFENNTIIFEEMKKVLDIVYDELTELLEPLNLNLSSHYKSKVFNNGILTYNHYGVFIQTMIGGKKEHCGGSKDVIYVRLYCPYNNGKLSFEPTIKMYAQDVWNRSREIDFTSSENLIETFSKEIEKIYRNNI